MSIGINLWSGPRNLSTALMYSFAQRPDCIVFDEPLYAYYLTSSGAQHPGRDEVIASQPNNANTVINNIILEQYDKPVAFFKQMAHHLFQLNKSFLLQCKNILYIRNPQQVIQSYYKVTQTISLADIGIKEQVDIFDYLRQHQQTPVVLDSSELLKNPSTVLQQLCTLLQIPFYEQMLSWPAGEKEYDGVWAKHWYKNVHASTGFSDNITKPATLPEHLQSLSDESMQYYNQLYSLSIKA